MNQKKFSNYCALKIVGFFIFVCMTFTRIATASSEDTLVADPESLSLPESNLSLESGEEPFPKLTLPLGPVFIQKTPELERIVVFPLFFHDSNKTGDLKNFTGLFPFYVWKNGRGENSLIVFPVLWNFNLISRSVFMVPPIYVEKKDNGNRRVFIAPLLFLQTGKPASFQFIPPVFFNFSGEGFRFTYSLLFYRWVKGEKYASGILPLAYWGKNEGKGYNVVLPLFWRFFDEGTGLSKLVFPPFYYMKELSDWKAGMIPLVFATRMGEETQATVLPLIHLRKNRDFNSLMLVTPLGWYYKNEKKKAKGGGVLLAHQFESEEKKLLLILPFYYNKTIQDLMQTQTLYFPFLYLSKSPIYRNVSVLGVVWDFERFGERKTYGVLPFFMLSKELYRPSSYLLWVAPTFQFSRNMDEWRFYIHPLYYMKGGTSKTFSVLFPVWWRFSEPKSLKQVFFPLLWDFKNLTIDRRITLFFPLFLRYRKGDSTHSAFLLFYHWKGNVMGQKSWRFSLIPVFGFGHTDPDDYYWKILYGLIGYEKSKENKEISIFWLPIKLK